MLDCYSRHINYLRISLTDRCNLACTYCTPESGRTFLSREKLLSDDEIRECVKVAAGFGVTKVRFTGGEPLLRKNIHLLIRNVAEIKGIMDISITTNGIFLEQHAVSLASAGLKRVNVSLDTVDPLKYSEITRGGKLRDVLGGLEAARKAGLMPVKINCVITNSPLEKDASEVKKYCDENGFEVRFIRQMNLEKGIFYPVDGGEGGNCHSCNRMRLTADGYFKPCLFDPDKYSIREYGIGNAFRMAVENKPQKGTIDAVNEFYNIGG